MLCKRRNNLLKKAMQLSVLCEQEIFMAVYDKQLNKMIRYQSSDLFNIGRVSGMFD